MKKISCVLLLTLLFACNKNSTELPPIKQPTKVTQICYLNGIAAVEATIASSALYGQEKLTVQFKNLSSGILRQLRIAVMICNAFPTNYDNCIYQKTIYMDSLVKDAASPAYTLFNNQGIDLNSAMINTGIVAIADVFSSRIANNYASLIVGYEKDSSHIHYGFAKGYILSDGTFHLLLKNLDSLNTIHYNRLQGNFFSGAIFSGFLDERIAISLDSVTVSGNKVLIDSSQAGVVGLRFKLKNTIQDSIKSIYLQLKKEF